jgi:DNA replication protein DnaC
MNDARKIIPLPVERARVSDPMTRVDASFRFPDSSRDPTGLDWECPRCGVHVLPQYLPNGLWVRRRACTCQVRKHREEEAIARMHAWDVAQASRTFGSWLGVKWKDEGSIATLRRKTFTNFIHARDQAAYDQAVTFATSMSGNFLLYGEYGAGKTHLAAAICNQLRAKQVASLFMAASVFFAAYNERQHLGEDCYWLERQATLTPLLVIDDVDKAHATEARLDVYWRILEGRYNGRRPTVITTNRMAPLLDSQGRVVSPGLADYIGGAARSRFMRGLVAVEMQGSDYRMEEK